MPSEDEQQSGGAFPFGAPLDAQNRNVHPWPSYAPIGDEFPENNYEFPERPGVTDAPPDVTLGPGETLTPIVQLRQESAAQPKIIRSPAILKYPKSRRTLFINSGESQNQVSLGFDCRAIQVQNVGTNGVLFCPELNIYLTTAPTPLVTFNLPEMAERLSFIWYTAVFDPTPPAAVPGQGAVVWLYDEWIPPVSAAASSGGGTATVTVEDTEPPPNVSNTQVNDSAVDVQLLSADPTRRMASFANVSDQILYLAVGFAPTVTNYTVAIAPLSAEGIPGYYELPSQYAAQEIRGIWAADSTGQVNITEVTV